MPGIPTRTVVREMIVAPYRGRPAEYAPTPCDRVGTHVTLPDGTTCGTHEWLSCDECGRFERSDPHAPCSCGIPSNLPTLSDVEAFA